MKLFLARIFHGRSGAEAPNRVAQVSKPAVSPISKSAGCRNYSGAGGYNNPRYSRLRSLRNKIAASVLIATTTHGATDSRPATEIDFADQSTHIAGITADTLVVATGSTYSFTVDSPEDQGPISTGIQANQLPLQIKSKNDTVQNYRVIDKNGSVKSEGDIATGDRFLVTSGDLAKTYQLEVKKMALSGDLRLEQQEITVNTERELTLYFTAGQRSPKATAQITIPPGIEITMDNTTVNVIGRGDVKLRDLSTQSIGRAGTNYSYSKVGEVEIIKPSDGGSILRFTQLDLRPANGPDLKIAIAGVRVPSAGKLTFRASYTTTEPEVLTSAGVGPETATLTAVRTISDFARILDTTSPYRETPETYTSARFKWTSGNGNTRVQLQHSLDKGKTWSRASGTIDPSHSTASVSGLKPNTLYLFRLSVADGEHQGFSNPAHFHTGKWDIKSFGVSGDGMRDDTDAINKAIESLAKLGGGILLFSDGIYKVRTVHLRSHVYLYLDRGATIKALKNGDAPEPTWFSDKQYRSGLSPTALGPYRNPENWLTKQDVGHTYFRNSMFFAERMDDIKIIGSGRITGDGNLMTSDRVMSGEPDKRSDKMFTFKLCTNIEIGGLHRDADLWYDPNKDEPYFIGKDGSKDFDCGNMLQIDRGGHFVLLATGTDNIHVHNTYFAKHDGTNARDIYDFMGCSDVTVINIYSKVSSDDIVKLGSDCSLGFTRKASNYRIRNIIGDTNCNLFQIGSETADDITDVHVDNIYVLGSNKAGFSISTNDGATVRDIHLNCGHTGVIHSRSKMYRTRAPFFISISNRGRVIGADVKKYLFTENGRERDELLCRNVDIGTVENIILNAIDIYEVYGGSSHGNRTVRWKPFDGSQNRATPIVAGYALPESGAVKGGLDFTLPNGKHAGYIRNIEFNDVNVLVKGGNPLTDRTQSPPELGVGQYNVSNLSVQPAYGLWARHAMNLTVKNCSFNYEERDSRYALFLDDVINARISSVKMVRARDNDHVIATRNSRNVIIEDSISYDDTWGHSSSDIHSENSVPDSSPRSRSR
jgi:polygalacturonase